METIATRRMPSIQIQTKKYQGCSRAKSLQTTRNYDMLCPSVRVSPHWVCQRRECRQRPYIRPPTHHYLILNPPQQLTSLNQLVATGPALYYDDAVYAADETSRAKQLRSIAGKTCRQSALGSGVTKSRVAETDIVKLP
jgi:hypothetical protein